MADQAGEEKLSASRVRHFEEMLDRKKMALIEHINEQLHESQDQSQIDLATQLTDPGDRSVSELLQDMRLEHLERETEELHAVEEAEGRLHNGSYGICTDCGSPISSKRLEAQPSASRCIMCQEVHERTYASH